MKLNVNFSENDLNIAVELSEDNQDFNPNMGELYVQYNGQNGATFTPNVSPDGVISWTNDRDLPNPVPVNIKGADGAPGADGKDGAKGEDGKDGADGAPGKDGANGKDGVSATHKWNGTKLTITSASGTSTADLKGDKGDTGPQGVQGIQGPKGDKGDKGATGATGAAGHPGADGFSPTVAVADIDGGHRVSVTDKNGTKTFDVMDGKDGKDGEGGTGRAVQADWEQMDETQPDYIKNKPFGEEVAAVNEPLNIQWDGNTEGLLCVADAFFLVSTDVFSNEDIQKMTATILSGNGNVNQYSFADSWHRLESMGYVSEDWVAGPNEPHLIFVRKENTYIEWMGLTFPKAGIYFLNQGGYTKSLTSTEPVPQTKTIVHPIDSKYLPEPLHFGDVPDSDTLTWDGNTAGLLKVEHTNEPYTLYKVSDTVLTWDDILCEEVAAGAMARLVCMYGEIVPSCNDEMLAITDDVMRQFSFGEQGYYEGVPILFFTDRVVCTMEDNVRIGADGFGWFHFPEKGIYFTSDVTSFYLASKPFTITKPIESKYLPMSDITAAVIAALPTWEGGSY